MPACVQLVEQAPARVARGVVLETVEQSFGVPVHTGANVPRHRTSVDFAQAVRKAPTTLRRRHTQPRSGERMRKHLTPGVVLGVIAIVHRDERERRRRVADHVREDQGRHDPEQGHQEGHDLGRPPDHGHAEGDQARRRPGPRPAGDRAPTAPPARPAPRARTAPRAHAAAARRGRRAAGQLGPDQPQHRSAPRPRSCARARPSRPTAPARSTCSSATAPRRSRSATRSTRVAGGRRSPTSRGRLPASTRPARTTRRGAPATCRASPSRSTRTWDRRRDKPQPSTTRRWCSSPDDSRRRSTTSGAAYIDATATGALGHDRRRVRRQQVRANDGARCTFAELQAYLDDGGDRADDHQRRGRQGHGLRLSRAPSTACASTTPCSTSSRDGVFTDHAVACATGRRGPRGARYAVFGNCGNRGAGRIARLR